MQAIRANDAAAAKLSGEAKAQLDIANNLKAQEAKYQAAMKDGQAALDRKDYSSAIAQAALALTARLNDPAATKLKGDAQAQLQIANNLKVQQDAEAAKMRQSAQTPKSGPSPATPNQVVTAGTEKQNRTNDIGMEFVWISKLSGGGAFLGRCEVTQKQFRTVTGKLPEDQAAVEDDLPVANVTFDQAKDFCDRLGKRDGKRYSLPSKEDWLAAAGISPEEVNGAWAVLKDKGALEHEVTSLKGKPLTRPARVGSNGTQANGLSDLFGNVRELLANRESAGFSYDTEGFGQRKALFVTGEGLKSITGFRCVLRDSD